MSSFGYESIFGDDVKAQKSYYDIFDVTKQSPTKGWSFDTALDKDNLWATLGGAGEIIGTLGSVYSGFKNERRKDELYKLEKNRLARAEKKSDDFKNSLKSVWE